MDEQQAEQRSALPRIVVAVSVALGLAFGVYLLLEAMRPQDGLIGFAFLLVLPAAISAFVAYVADPWGERRLGQYLMVPVWLLAAIIVASVVVLREGVICVLILSPLWLLSGLAGAGLTFKLRNRVEAGRSYCAALLLAPLLAIQVEPLVPLPVVDVSVVRAIVVAAPPARIWPLLRGIPDVRPGEGRWNLSQDVIGIPRPVGARLVGEGIGAERRADWGTHVRFRERIVAWTPERRIGWRFVFDDIAGWRFTDRHLMPDTRYFRITTGGYTLEPLAGGRTRVTLDTHYRIRTPVNAYSALWGELFLGDLEDNLLALVRQRAERPAGSAR